VDGGGKTVGGGVANLDGVFLGLELGDRADWAEDLLLHDLHVLADIAEDCGLNEVSSVTMSSTTSLDRGTGLLACLNVSHDAVELELGDLRTLEGALVVWVSNIVRECPLLESLDELIIDTLLNVNS